MLAFRVMCHYALQEKSCITQPSLFKMLFEFSSYLNNALLNHFIKNKDPKN